MSRSIPINPEQIENAIKLIEAKIGMQQEKLAALVVHSKATRKLVRQFITSQTRTCDLELKWWADSHEAQEKAERAVIEVQIAELKSQLAVNQFMLEEAKSQGSGLVKM